MKIGEQSAFPMSPAVWSKEEGFVNGTTGMTLKQHYIGCALTGLLANPALFESLVEHVKIEAHERAINAMAIAQVDDLLALMEEEQA